MVSHVPDVPGGWNGLTAPVEDGEAESWPKGVEDTILPPPPRPADDYVLLKEGEEEKEEDEDTEGKYGDGCIVLKAEEDVDCGVMAVPAVKLRVSEKHPLWAHHIWNAATVVADWFDDVSFKDGVAGSTVLELGAGSGLPGIVAGMNGASVVVLTDYPEARLMYNLSLNFLANPVSTKGTVRAVEPYKWGEDVAGLMRHLPEGSEGFDWVVCSDLIFNHSSHGAILATLAKTLHPTRGRAIVAHSHHVTRAAAKDMGLFRMAGEYGLSYRHLFATRLPVMFPEDPGPIPLRSTVQVWQLSRPEVAVARPAPSWTVSQARIPFMPPTTVLDEAVVGDKEEPGSGNSIR